MFTSQRALFSAAMAPIFAFWGTCKRGAATAVYDYARRAYTQYAPEVVMRTFRRVFVEAPCLPASGVGE